jgi:purine-binding chemotaxis protein CheW
MLDEALYDDEEDEDTQKDKYLTFHLAEEDYGIEIRYVTEILSFQKITAVPDLPNFVKGVVNLRGQVIPVVDLRLRFGLEEREYTDRTCIIFTKVRENSVGLVVDTVNEVRDIPAKDVAPPPQVSKGVASRFVQGLGRINDKVEIILNADLLLSEDDAEALQSAAL